MSMLRPLDPVFPIERQLAVDASPVVLVNVFTLDKADEQASLRAWHDDALFMKQQRGFISTQLHRAIGESPTYLPPGCIHESSIPGQAFQLSVFGSGYATPVPEGRRPERVRGIEAWPH